MDPVEPTLVSTDAVEDVLVVPQTQRKAPIIVEELLTSFLTGVQYSKEVIIARFMELFDEAIESVLLDSKTTYSYMSNECGTIRINITRKIEGLYSEFFGSTVYALGDNIVFKNAITKWNAKHSTLKLTYSTGGYHTALILSGFDTLAEYRAWAKVKLNAVTSYRLGAYGNAPFVDASIFTSGMLTFAFALLYGVKFVAPLLKN